MIKRKLREIADRQAGYFTARQAKTAGYTDKHNAELVERGTWIGIERGLFRLPGYADTLEGEFIRWSFWAIGRSVGQLAVISHDSALYYHGMTDDRPHDVHLTVSAKRLNKTEKPGCILHRHELNWNELIHCAGFNVTTPTRTLLDMKPDLLMQGRWAGTVLRARDEGLLEKEVARTLLGDTLYEEVTGNASNWARLSLPVRSGTPNDTVTGSATMQTKRRADGLRNLGANEWRTHSRSFTLIELLVVVMIISVLAALLMPALNSAIRTAKGSSCTNNLRQFGQATMAYTDTYQNVIYPKDCTDEAMVSQTWGYLLFPYIGGKYFGYMPLANSSGQLGIYNCPENSAQRCSVGFTITEADTSYATNGMNNWGNDQWSYRAFGAKVSRIRYPSEFFLIYDNYYFREQGYSGPVGAPNACLPESAGIGGVNQHVRYAHNYKASMLFLDGHTQMLGPIPGREAQISTTAFYPDRFVNGRHWLSYQ